MSDKAAGLGIAEPGREGSGLRPRRRQCLLQSRDTGLGRFRVFGKRLPEAGDFVPSRCTPAFGCRQLPSEKGGLVLRRRELLFQRRDAPGRRFNHLRKHPPEPGDPLLSCGPPGLRIAEPG